MTISKKYKNSNIKILEKEFTKGAGFTGFAASNKLRTDGQEQGIKYHTIGLSSKTNNNFVTDNIPQVVNTLVKSVNTDIRQSLKTAVKKIKKTPLIDTTKLLTQ